MPKTTHGMWKSKEWNSWDHMKRRCNNPNDPRYKTHGARGIKVCERWMKFENFYLDMGPAPSDKHSIDRYPNNDGNYEPGNCRWATPTEQANNTRRNVTVTYKGTSLPLTEWAKKLHISADTLTRKMKEIFEA